MQWSTWFRHAPNRTIRYSIVGRRMLWRRSESIPRNNIADATQENMRNIISAQSVDSQNKHTANRNQRIIEPMMNHWCEKPAQKMMPNSKMLAQIMSQPTSRKITSLRIKSGVISISVYWHHSQKNKKRLEKNIKARVTVEIGKNKQCAVLLSTY